MLKKISIIIPSLNEGDELVKTISSINKAAKRSLYEVIVIDDASDTGKWADPPQWVKVLHNDERLGRPASVQKGVDAARYEAIIVLNARMRFTEGWIEKYLKNLNENPESLICATCVYLNYGDDEITDDKPRKYGSTLTFYDPDAKFVVFNNHWNTAKGSAALKEVDVCLGASTATTRKWWDHIHGLRGLHAWGSADAFLAVKTRMAGGKCYVMTDCEIGNIFRSDYYEGEKKIKYKQHYPASPVDTVMNKMFMIYTLLPRDKQWLVYKLKKCRGYEMALHWYANRIGEMEKERQYIRSIRKRSLTFNI